MTINFLNYNKEIKVQNKKIGKLGNYLNMVYQLALNQVCKSKSGDWLSTLLKLVQRCLSHPTCILEIETLFWIIFVWEHLLCPCVVTNRIQIKLLSSFSLMNCLSISTCLVLSYGIELWLILIVVLLSYYTFIGSTFCILNSIKGILRHNNSQCVIALNLSLALDWAMKRKLSFTAWLSHNSMLFASPSP